MAVEFITYQGEKLPINISYMALKRMRKELNVDIENPKNLDQFEILEPMLFYGLQDGYRIEKKEFSFKMEDMELILNECWMEFGEVLQTFFPDELVKMLEVGGQSPTPKVRRVK